MSLTSKSAEREGSVASSRDTDQDSDIDLAQTGSRKRRRISQTSGHDGSDSALESASSKSMVAAPTVSRIKIKSSKPRIATPDDAQPGLMVPVDTTSSKSNFPSLDVDQWLVSSLAAMAIKRPTGIQQGCIPEILKGRDCIGGSRTGSGKTVAFAVPILQKWARDPIGIFAVVLTPTRELALQIYEQFNAIAAPMSCKIALVTGGADMRTQALALASRPHIVVATPGRLADHVSQSGEDTICGLRRVAFVVFDEADRLLSSGAGSMLPDIETCLSVFPPSTSRQTCLFTATITPEVRALQTLPRPPSKPPAHVCEIDTGLPAIPSTLNQTYILIPAPQKEAFLHMLLLTPANASRSTIIFANHTTTATILEHTLRLLSHRVTALHSSLPQSTRTANLARFRSRAARILIATDVASRGLDIPSVALVVNFDVPRSPDDYIHRVGRTARAGREGLSVTFVGQRDVELVQAIEGRVGAEMKEYEEEGVNLETRVVRDGLKVVSEKKREALLGMEEGRDVKGKKRRGYTKMNKK